MNIKNSTLTALFCYESPVSAVNFPRNAGNCRYFSMKYQRFRVFSAAAADPPLSLKKFLKFLKFNSRVETAKISTREFLKFSYLPKKFPFLCCRSRSCLHEYLMGPCMSVCQLVNHDLQRRKLSSKDIRSARGQKSWKCEEESTVSEKNSKFGFLMCCMLYTYSTVSSKGPLVYLEQIEGKNLPHRTTSLKASKVIDLLWKNNIPSSMTALIEFSSGSLSCRVRARLADASLFPADSNSVRPVNRAQKSSLRPRIESVACLIPSSTDLSVNSTANVSVPHGSTSGSCLSLKPIVTEELQSVWVSASVPLLIN